MKSLLVDVLRQANGGSPDKTLSDSGSFDATRNHFPDTANDPVVEDGQNADEALALFETSTSVHAPGDNDDAQFTEFEDFLPADDSGNAASEPARVVRHPSAFDKGPAVARFAPLACLVLALLTAALWTAYQNLKLKYAESELASAQIGHSAAYVSTLASDGEPATVERFPFLGADATGDTETVE